LGIDVGGDGVTPNDPAEADTAQNFPALVSASTRNIQGTLNSAANTTFTIEFFSNTECDPSGFGEGEVFIGSTVATTNGSGVANFSFNLTAAQLPGRFVTATASDPFNNTSEFSNCVQVDLARTVILATNSILLEEDSDVLSGNVVVNEASHGPVLDSGVEASIGDGVTMKAGFSLQANRIRLKQSSTVRSDVFYNHLSSNGTITGALNTPLNLPVFPTLPPFKSESPEGQNVTVEQRQALTLTHGNYGDIVVKNNGKLIFTGGVYNLRSIDISARGELLFLAPSEVRVADKLNTDQNVYIGPNIKSRVGASSIIFYVAGVNGDDGNLAATPKAAQIGIHNTVLANFYVPNGTLWLRQGTNATGAFFARDVDVGIKVKVALDSFFKGQ
jgi:hypothetical protein